MNYAIKIPVTGEPVRVAAKPTLEQMQEFLKGYVQPLRVTFEGRSCTMLCNEDGFALGLSTNAAATKIVKDSYGPDAQTIVGNVIVLVGYRF